MKKLIAVAAVAFGMVLSNSALAHGAQAKHGGVVSSAGDLAFELVSKDGKAIIYVEDHGRELSTREAKGTLTVLQGKKRAETVLEPSDHNTLTSKADVKLTKGTKAVASITLAGKEPISVRFSAK
ncbi:hypothetical protein PO883_29615 [Massilia sp. DJPM01]|uniref:hypothetical protein n=1 Tax=Massilia sp. DJPM01 TaxID=3024404 RepID=UPI00259EA4FE|nr:hypothetical protein [Massilia sp. DJPM01]MDM5181344.1 hypothetical protein [Massilia sp. DJPM01]